MATRRLPRARTKKRGLPVTDRCQKFIERMAHHGQSEQAAVEAGYSAKSAASMGRTLAAKYRDEIQQGLADRIGSEQSGAFEIICDLAANSENDQVRLKAAMDIMSRGPHLAGQRLESDNPDAQSIPELIEEMLQQVGPELTAQILTKQGIPVPEHIAEACKAKETEQVEPEQEPKPDTSTPDTVVVSLPN